MIVSIYYFIHSKYHSQSCISFLQPQQSPLVLRHDFLHPLDFGISNLFAQNTVFLLQETAQNIFPKTLVSLDVYPLDLLYVILIVQQVPHVLVEVLPLLIREVHVPVDFLPCREDLYLSHVVEDRIDVCVQHAAVLVTQFCLLVVRGFGSTGGVRDKELLLLLGLFLRGCCGTLLVPRCLVTTT